MKVFTLREMIEEVEGRGDRGAVLLVGGCETVGLLLSSLAGGLISSCTKAEEAAMMAESGASSTISISQSQSRHVPTAQTPHAETVSK